MKIIITPESFKGTLTALEAALAIEQGMAKVFPKAEYLQVPMADGGEGTVQSLVDASQGKIITCRVKDPLGRDIEAHFGLMGGGKTAVIEMAAASGLPLLKKEERNPLKTTTYGTGQLIKEALNRGVSKIIVGIGGSATVDGGVGMAQALGVVFKDSLGNELEGCGGALKNLASIDTGNMDHRIKQTEFLVACDVTNPLLGETGAPKVYGPQKGATPGMVNILEEALTNFSQIVKNELAKEIANLPGAGAAGGLGGGLVAFCNAKLMPGIDIVTEAVALEDKIKNSDLVITGEGQIDYQTAFGKTPAGVAKTAKKFKVPVIAIGGAVGKDAREVLSHGISAYFSAIQAPLSDAEISKNAKDMLAECSEQIARVIKLGISC